MPHAAATATAAVGSATGNAVEEVGLVMEEAEPAAAELATLVREKDGSVAAVRAVVAMGGT
jgi:hypothetical protein